MAMAQRAPPPSPTGLISYHIHRRLLANHRHPDLRRRWLFPRRDRIGLRAKLPRPGPALDLKASIAPHLLPLLLVRSVAADRAASLPSHRRTAAGCPPLAPGASVTIGLRGGGDPSGPRVAETP